MVLIGAENLRPTHQVVELKSITAGDGKFQVSFEIHHPFTGKLHSFELSVPESVTPIDPIWDEVTEIFKELFPRRENMLVYRDVLRTLIIDEVYKRTRKPKKPVVEEKPRAEAKPTPLEDERRKKLEDLRELMSKISQMEKVLADETQPEAERKKAEIRLKGFRTKAEGIAKEIGVDLSKPLPEELPKMEEAEDEKAKRYQALREILSKIAEMEKIIADESQPESERKKAEIRIRAFKTKAEAEAKALGVDITKPLPQSLAESKVEASEDRIGIVKTLLKKAREAEALAVDENAPESEREKAKIRARAFRAKAEKEAEAGGIDISTISLD